MIGRDADVRRAVLEHLQHRLQHADDGAERAVDAFVETPQAVEMTEQLVGAVDEVNDHSLKCVKLELAADERNP